MTWTGTLISLAVLQQALESLFIPSLPWTVLKDEVPRALRPFVRYDRMVQLIRATAALISLYKPSWGLALVMALGTWSTAVRWRGTFNGGSDRTVFLILVAWTWALARPEAELSAMRLVGLELTLSYGVAGFAKLAQREWRRGQAPAQFLPGLKTLPRGLQTILALFVMTFECTFPAAYLGPRLAAIYLTLGFGFHLVNAYALGLNRFFFAWIAAYPTLWLLCQN